MRDEEPIRPDRLNAFSDGLFAVIITILVLEIHRRVRQTSKLSMMRIRSLATLAVFSTAAVVALRYPIGGMAMICLCLLVYLSPATPGAQR